MSFQPRSASSSGFVPDGDVFRRQVRARGAEQVFPVQVFRFRLRGVDPEQAARSNAQVAVQAGPGSDDAAQLGALAWPAGRAGQAAMVAIT